MKLSRVADQMRRASRRAGQVDVEIAEMKRERAGLVATFNARLDQVEANTARIDAIETGLAEHVADKKGHK